MGSSSTGASGDPSVDSDDNTVKTDSDVDDENDVASVPTSDSCSFSVGEKVLVYHSLSLYDAKVMKTDYRSRKFFIHYQGWRKTWDEWVGIDRLLKCTQENIQKQHSLNIKQGTDKNVKPGRASHIKPKSSNVVRGKKRRSDSVEEKSGLPLEKFLNIQIPLTLRKQLVDDCEFITHLGKLVKLPRNPSVDDILKKYLDYRFKKDGVRDVSVEEIVKGLLCYFEKALPAMLLYKSERPQYEEAIAEDVLPSTIYGAEHLLRLFVRLPELLFQAKFDEETLAELRQKLVEFLKFLQKNKTAFFLSTYHIPEDVETSTVKQDD